MNEWIDVPDSDFQVMIRSNDPLDILWVRKTPKPKRGRPRRTT